MKLSNKLLIIFAILMLVIVGGIVGLKSYLNYKFNKSLTPREREEIKKFTGEKLVFIKPEQPALQSDKPDNKHTSSTVALAHTTMSPMDIKPFPPDLIQLVKEHELLLKDIRKTKLYDRMHQSSEPLIDDTAFMDDISSGVKQYEPAINLLSKIVDHPDYDTEVWMSTDTYIDNWANTFPVKAKILVEIKNENYSDALKYISILIKHTKSSPYAMLYVQYSNIFLLHTCAKDLRIICEKSNDMQVLTVLLKFQDQYSNYFNRVSADINQFTIDNISLLRMKKRQGMNINIDGMTEMQIATERYRVEIEYTEKYELPKLKDKPDDKEYMQKMLEYKYDSYVQLGGPPKGFKQILLSLGSPYFKLKYAKDAAESEISLGTLGYFPETFLNILRTETANKIYALRNNKQAESLSILEGIEIDKIPGDLFSETKEPLKYQNGKVYSIGPDNADQKAEVYYDPTNGISSTGDLFFRD